MSSGSIFRILTTFLFAYLFFIGATFNGILNPSLKLINLILLVVILGTWLGIRTLRKWQWHALALDKAFGLWGVVIVISLLANMDSWRRIVMGIWFVVLYVLIWYMLQDGLANKAIDRDSLVDMILMGSVVVVVFGFVQLTTIDFDLTQLELPRPGSTIGNPNSFGAFLIMIFPFSLSRALLLKNWIAKIVLGLYSLVLLFLLFLTFSRGAWIGGFVALVMIGMLYLQHQGLLSVVRIKQWWGGLQGAIKSGLMAMMIAGVIIAIMGGVLLLDSLDTGGRDVNLRTRIYEFAFDLVNESPITGHGLFTFGQGYERLESMPPHQPHSHAHNLVLNVSAEMGLLGLIALVLTVMIASRQMIQNWRQSTPNQRPVLMGTIGAVIGFGTHHLFDTPAMMPVIALMGLLALSLATASSQVPQPVTMAWRRIGQSISMIVMVSTLLISGFWSAGIYQQYVDALKLANEDNGRDYLSAAEAMQSVIDSDPSLGLYHGQQGFLYGMDADINNNFDSARLGIESYQQYLDIEPHSAVGWANIAGLYWQIGEHEQAFSAMRGAVQLAPLSWQLQLNLGIYAEATGNETLARQAYAEALDEGSYIFSFWQETPLRQDVWSEFAPTGLNQLQLALLNNEPLSSEQVDDLWEESGLASRERTDRYIYRLLLEMQTGESANFEALLSDAVSYVDNGIDRAWMHIGQAYIAQYLGDNLTFQRELVQARELIEITNLDADYLTGVNIGHFQYLRLVLPRQFLPQVVYPSANVFLLRLIEG